MSKAKWTGAFAYFAADLALGGAIPKVELIGLGSESVPLSYFSVAGGATRKIKLSTTDDLSLSSELEQARRFSNIRLYLSPKSVFSSGELIQIAAKNITFGMTVAVSCRFGKTVSQSLLFGSKDARLVEMPRKITDSQGTAYFFVNVQFTQSELVHIAPRGKEQVAEAW